MHIISVLSFPQTRFHKHTYTETNIDYIFTLLTFAWYWFSHYKNIDYKSDINQYNKAYGFNGLYVAMKITLLTWIQTNMTASVSNWAFLRVQICSIFWQALLLCLDQYDLKFNHTISWFYSSKIIWNLFHLHSILMVKQLDIFHTEFCPCHTKYNIYSECLNLIKSNIIQALYSRNEIIKITTMHNLH